MGTFRRLSLQWTSVATMRMDLIFKKVCVYTLHVHDSLYIVSCLSRAGTGAWWVQNSIPLQFTANGLLIKQAA